MDATNTAAGRVEGAKMAEYEKATRYPTTKFELDVWLIALNKTFPDPDVGCDGRVSKSFLRKRRERCTRKPISLL